MNSFIKFLSIPILSLGMIGCASSAQQVRYEPYSENSEIPTIDDLLQYKKIKPIDINNPVVKKCFEYLEIYDISNKRLLNRLMCLIYEFAEQISLYIDGYIARADYDTNLKIIVKLYNDRKEEPIYNNELRKKNINVNGWQFFDVDVLLKHIQKILDPKNKYKGKIIYDNNSLYKTYNIMELFYYIANRFVQISHDIINAVNKKIEENKSLNKDEILKTSRYIRDEIVTPCYKNIKDIIHIMGNSILNIVQKPSIFNESPKLGKFMEDMLKFIKYNGDESFNKVLQSCKSSVCENISGITQEILQQLNKCTKEVRNNENIETKIISRILERIFTGIQEKIYETYINFSNSYNNIICEDEKINDSIIYNYYLRYIEKILNFNWSFEYDNFYRRYEDLMREHNLKPQDMKIFSRYYLANKKYIDTILEPLYKLKTHEFVTKSMLDFDYEAEAKEILKNT